MTSIRRTAALAAALTASIAGLAGASTAHAGFVPAVAIDGPSTDPIKVGDLDVARDGHGAVVYVRTDGGVPHVFASRLVAGVFQPPERLDAALPGAATQAAVAVADGGQMVAIFINAGVAYATVRPFLATAWTAPQPLAEAASDPSVDMSINGVAYTTFASAGDLRAARMDRGSTTFTLLPSGLDLDAAAVAGTGAGRSRVAVSADGTALAVWGEGNDVVARRLFGLNVSAAPQTLAVPTFDGHVGFAATSPDVGIEDDSSFAWVTYRQNFDVGGPQQARVLARRLRGSRFDDPVVVDGQAWGGESAGSSDIAVSGRGAGVASAGGASSGSVFGAVLKDDQMNPGAPLGGGGIDPQPVGTVAETPDRTVAWLDGGAATGRPVSVQARFFPDRAAVRSVPTAGPAAGLAAPDLGPVDPSGGLDGAGNRVGDSAYVFVQSGGDGRRLVAAFYDRAPGALNGYTTQSWRKYARPPLRWSPSQDLNGGVTYQVLIDNVAIAQTRETKLTPLNIVADGEHRWRVVATDRFGQSVSSKSRLLRVDATKPTVSFRVKRKGSRATVTATATDPVGTGGKRASGIKVVKIDFGDGSPVVTGKKASHDFGRKGRFTIRVSATDRAGNAVADARRVRVK